MKRIKKPSFDPAVVLDACTSGISDPQLATRFKAARPYLLAKFHDYELNADTHNLFSFNACSWGDGTQVVVADMSKKELVDLYSDQMVVGSKPGRKQYDSLMMLAPLGKCPFCGFGQVSTLDHFLSKSRYPMFSVLTFNLIPSCSDCNTGKGSSVLANGTQILHPYFEDAVVETVPWLFSELIESVPAAVQYFVKPPTNWSAGLAIRVTNHFKDLELAKRFGVEAASELASLSDILDALETPEAREIHLLSISRVERKKRTNSWRAALYEAVAGSPWYKKDGFRNPDL